jgi:predicted outer membrane repeat protein
VFVFPNRKLLRQAPHSLSLSMASASMAQSMLVTRPHHRFTDNIATGAGGAIYATSAGPSEALVVGSSFANNGARGMLLTNKLWWGGGGAVALQVRCWARFGF